MLVLVFQIFSMALAQDPSAIMLYPVPRLHTKHDLKDVEPCGGMAKGKSHLLSEPGSLNPISWMVKSADGDGIC